MKVKEVYVTRENPAEIFSIIERQLSIRPNTQVFIDYKIYEELKRNDSVYHVWQNNYLKGYHYYHNDDNFGGEEWLTLYEEGHFDKKIAIGSFISNSKEYMQLVNFDSSKVKDYTHYLAGFKQLLLILFKPE